MVVHQDDRRRRVADGGREDLPRVDERRGEGSFGDAHLAANAILAVEEQHVEDLTLELREASPEVTVDGARVAHRTPERERDRRRPPPELEGCRHPLRTTRRPAAERAPRLPGEAVETGEAARRGEQPLGERERGAPAGSPPE